MANPSDFKTIWFVRSLDATAARYKIEQKQDAGAWSTIAYVYPIGDRWSYQYETAKLDDLADFTWRITTLDAEGNASSSTEIGPETHVRTPAAPDFDLAFDAATQRVTISEHTAPGFG